MSMAIGTSSTERYALSPSTSASFGLIGTTWSPWLRKARTALFPNFDRSENAPITATTLGTCHHSWLFVWNPSYRDRTRPSRRRCPPGGVKQRQDNREIDHPPGRRDQDG